MRFLPLLFLFFSTSLCFTQTTVESLRDRLLQKPLYLRGQWGSDHLSFDSAGILMGKSSVVSFTLSGFLADSVKSRNGALELKGTRVGIEFVNGKPRLVKLAQVSAIASAPEAVTISVAAPSDGNFEPALKAIFFENANELVEAVPSHWQNYAHEHILGASAQPVAVRVDVPCDKQSTFLALHNKNGITFPHLLQQKDPEFNDTARAMRYSGSVVIGLVVDTQGMPTKLCIRQATGLGLDERALAAVSQYRFAPATRDGSPVAVKLDVVVKFEIF